MDVTLVGAVDGVSRDEWVVGLILSITDGLLQSECVILEYLPLSNSESERPRSECILEGARR